MQAPSDHLRMIATVALAQFSTSIEENAGPYRGWGRDGDLPCMVEVDARPMLALIEDALLGIRVYEFMTIDRPGDVLNYLRIRPPEVHSPCQNCSQRLK